MQQGDIDSDVKNVDENVTDRVFSQDMIRELVAIVARHQSSKLELKAIVALRNAACTTNGVLRIIDCGFIKIADQILRSGQTKLFEHAIGCEVSRKTSRVILMT